MQMSDTGAKLKQPAARLWIGMLHTVHAHCDAFEKPTMLVVYRSVGVAPKINPELCQSA